MSVKKRIVPSQAGLSRRRFGQVLGGGVLSLLASSPVLNAQSPTKVNGGDDLLFRSATDLARLIRTKEISSVELVQAYIRRIGVVNRKLNAVCQLDVAGALSAAKAADAALAQGKAQGVLHGVPVTIKDSFDTAGIVSTAGTTGRRNYIPTEDATVVKRLRAAGAIILGKTNTPELTLSYETDNLIYGRTNNPYDLSRTPGGSCGGSAAILAAGGSPIDVGSDTAGSLRVPAHFCGVAALKPSFGRVSRAGHIFPPGGVIGRRTHVGPMARYVEDLGLLLPVLSGPDSKDPDVAPVYTENPRDVILKTLRLAFFTSHDKSVTSPDIDRTVRAAARALADAGVAAEEKSPPAFDEADAILRVINAGDGGDYYRKILRQCGTTTPNPETTILLDNLRQGVVSGRKYSDVLLDWARFRETALDFMSGYELLLAPVCSGTAPTHGGTVGMDFSDSYYFNMLGWPAAVVRAGVSPTGLPIGVQIVGRPWADHHVLAAAMHVEKALGGYKRDFPEQALVGS